MKDLGKLRFGLEVDHSESGILISQKKLDVIDEFGMTKARPLHSPMDTHVKLTPTTGDLLPNADTYQRLGDINHVCIVVVEIYPLI